MEGPRRRWSRGGPRNDRPHLFKSRDASQGNNTKCGYVTSSLCGGTEPSPGSHLARLPTLFPMSVRSRLPAHITNNRTCGDAPTLADFFKSLIGRDFLKTTTYLFLKVDKYILIFNVCFAHENAVQT